MSITEAPTPIDRNEFRQAVRRNIRSLLALTEADQKQLAPRIGMNESQLSTRMSKAAWRDEELVNVARAFGTSYRAVVALTVDEFREAINEAPPVFHALAGSVQLGLFDSAPWPSGPLDPSWTHAA
jgi:hypothetical protein